MYTAKKHIDVQNRKGDNTMSEEKKSKKWYGWVKNIISAIAGAVISCAATIGIIGTDDATIAKQKIDGWMEKSDVVYEQVETVSDTIAEVKALIADRKYFDALAKLDTIKDAAATTISTVKELRDEIAEAAKTVSDEAKQKGDEIKETVKEAVDDIKEAVKDKPANEATPQD